jgi:MATE family multidrug resistance protein
MSIVRPVLISVLLGNASNIFLNWILIYGRLGFPAMGAVGSAWSTTISRWAMTLVLGATAWPVLREIWRRPDRELLDLRPYLHMLRIGIPIGVQIALEVWVFMTAGLLVGTMGSTSLSGHQIALNLASLSFMVPLGIGAAAATRVGNAIGRRDRDAARRSAIVSLALGALVMTISACVFAVFPRTLARIYSHDPEVIEAAAALLPIAAIFQVFDGTQAVGCGVLRGAGDTRAAAVINLLGYWVIALPIGAWLAFAFDLRARGLWWGLTSGLCLVAIALVIRIQRTFVVRAD